MLLDFILLTVGLAILIAGANWLVDGASSIAARFGVSSLVIGLTVVAFGTSLPELVVNLLAALRGSSDLALGNILGSNIANTLLIVGVAALIKPIRVQNSTVRIEIPLSLLAAVVLLVLANDYLIDGVQPSIISRSDGLILLLIFLIFIAYSFHSSGNKNGTDEPPVKIRRVIISIALIFVGLGGLWGGGHLIVEAATSIAQKFGVSDTIIGLTVLAIGTSLPELATTVMAAYKGNPDMAIGNIVGSNIFNILMVLGVTASISPLPFDTSANFHLLMVILSSVLLLAFCFIGAKQTIDRREGGLFVLLYFLYIAYLIIW